MTLHMEMATVDCAEPESLAQWWAQAVGGRVNAVIPGEFIIVALPDGPKLGFQHVGDPTPGKNRLHLDFHADDMEAEVTRLVGLGASETERHSFGDAFSWVVLADPAGNAFCIAGQ